MTKLCTINDCESRHVARGYCSKHYQRFMNDRPMEDKDTSIKYCSWNGCEVEEFCMNLCRMHYHRNRTGRDMDAPRRGTPVPCSVEGCERIRDSKGLCRGHRARMERGKSLETPLNTHRYRWDDPDLLDKLLSRTIETDNGCLEWQGHFEKYGRVSMEGRSLFAHRLSFAAKSGRDCDDLASIHHICANRRCINPEHLQEVTQRENNAEMLERNYYLKRINRLEAENKELRERLEAVLNGEDATETR